MRSGLLGFVLAGLCGLGAAQARAQDLSNVQVHAYGQIGYGVLLNGDGSTVTNTGINPTTGQPVSVTTHSPTTTYEGVTKGGTLDRDTRFGVNISGDLSPKVSFSLGLIAERYSLEEAIDRGSDWPLRTNLAVLRFEPGANVSIMVGRLSAPYWLISEEKYVGLTYPWIRPPLEVYQMVSGTENLDGGRLIYTLNLGEWSIKPSVFAGTFSTSSSPIGASDPTGSYRGGGGTIDVDYEWLTVHVIYSEAKGMQNGITPAGTTGVTTTAGTTAVATPAEPFTYGSKAVFENIGIRATPGNFLFMGEYARVQLPKYSTTGSYAAFNGAGIDRSGYYVTLGYNIGAFLPRVTYSSFTEKAVNVNDSPLGQAVASAPYSVAQAIEKTDLRSAAVGLQSKTINLGVNYQINPGTVLKVEWQQTRDPSSDDDGFFNLGPKGVATLGSAALDFAI